MRILIISLLFPPQNAIAALRPFSWAKYWSIEGHHVDVLTSLPNDSQPKLARCPSNYSFHLYQIAFPKVYYTIKSFYDSHFAPRSYVKNRSQTNQTKNRVYESFFLKSLKRLDDFRKKRGISRTARMPEICDIWGLQAYKWALVQGEWDFAISTFGPYINHIIGLLIKKHNLARKWIADFRDLWVDDHIYKGLWPFTVFEKLLEKQFMKSADFITTISEPLAEILEKKYGSKVRVIENGFDPEELETIPKERVFLTDKKIRIVYTGNIYPGKRDPTPLFSAISEIKNNTKHSSLLEKLEVIFFGKNEGDLTRLIDHFELAPYVKHRGYIPRGKSLGAQREADILLFLEWDDPKAKGVLTGKIFEYLWSGTPIWGIGIKADSLPGKLIRDSGAGYVFHKDIERIKQHLISILTNQEHYSLKFCVSQEFRDKYHRKRLAEKMIDLVR